MAVGVIFFIYISYYRIQKLYLNNVPPGENTAGSRGFRVIFALVENAFSGTTKPTVTENVEENTLCVCGMKNYNFFYLNRSVAREIHGESATADWPCTIKGFRRTFFYCFFFLIVI